MAHTNCSSIDMAANVYFRGCISTICAFGCAMLLIGTLDGRPAHAAALTDLKATWIGWSSIKISEPGFDFEVREADGVPKANIRDLIETVRHRTRHHQVIRLPITSYTPVRSDAICFSLTQAPRR